MGSKSGIGKQGIPEHGTVAPVVIRDEFGHDVTPRSLLPPAQATVTKASGADQSGSESQSSAFESAFGKGGAGMSSLGSESEVGGMPKAALELDEASVSDAEGEELVRSKPAPAAAPTAEPAEKPLTDEDLDALVTFTLSETDTFFLLDIAGTAVGADYAEAEAVKQANAEYDELLNKRDTMADMYVESPAQTFNLDTKPKEVQTTSTSKVEMACQANDWDLYDVMVGGSTSNGREDAADVEPGQPRPVSRSKGAAAAAGASAEGSSFAASGATEPSSLESTSGAAGIAGLEGTDELAAAAATGKTAEVSLKTLPALPSVLRIVERMVSQNIYQAKHLAYRHIAPARSLVGGGGPAAAADVSEGEGAAAAATFSLLWTFKSLSLSDGRNVSCLEFNPQNPDLLVAGYGEFDFSNQRSDGLILFWSLKNPDQPDKAILTSCGVTSIAFSHHHPTPHYRGLSNRA